jgi:hypothetical protein
MNADDALARKRFLALNLVRLSGLTMVLIGIAVHYGRIDLPEPAAYVLVVLGLADFFAMPNYLARKWRTPKA